MIVAAKSRIIGAILMEKDIAKPAVVAAKDRLLDNCLVRSKPRCGARFVAFSKR